MSSTSKTLLIHGFLGHPWNMGILDWRLRAAGHTTERFGYSSWNSSIATVADRLVRRLQYERFPVDVVAHSMGALVLRAALQRTPESVRRAVMLAPPNHGSPAAAQLGRPLRHLFPALAEMSDRDTTFLESLPPTLPCEFGIVSAERDHVVPERSTHLPGESAHVVVPGRHGTLPFQRDVAELTERFLENGTFVTSEALSDVPGFVLSKGTLR